MKPFFKTSLGLATQSAALLKQTESPEANICVPVERMEAA
jgi:hypothetical protein